ncbi:MAG: tryptophan--tRNA ligase [Gemmatales bacterium]|nr:tryptophan--tRNA ligase [Gemmatales bacterium]MDW8176542.1 tryptophan--tRNA ligase [Gemmatales bacterium]
MSTQASGSRLRILSGVQPSGKLHLGNYFGAIRQHIELQRQGECFYFIADLHALTTIQNADELQANVRDVALDYLALGLDPQRTVFFRQSDVPEVTELAWIFATVTGMGLLERAHSYKDKVARGLPASVGLFFYPVLMAADILIYRSHLVPVGQDQIQHIEITRDIAGYFNHTYGEIFPLPEYRLSEAPIVPGLDGKKMSKSYGNTIEIFATGQELRKKVMSIVTDSTPLDAPKDPEKCNVYKLYCLLATPEEQQELAAKYRAGGFGYGQAKQMLYEKLEGYFAQARQRRQELAREPGLVDEILRRGAQRAREEARATMALVRRAVGLNPPP